VVGVGDTAPAPARGEDSVGGLIDLPARRSVSAVYGARRINYIYIFDKDNIFIHILFNPPIIIFFIPKF